ncbi:MAG: hypothetical protein WA734_07450 [Candidatus Acidiferrales bacterium]
MENQFDYEWAFDEENGRVTGPLGKTIAFIAGGASPESVRNGKVIALLPELLSLVIESRGGISWDWKQQRDGILMRLGL